MEKLDQTNKKLAGIKRERDEYKNQLDEANEKLEREKQRKLHQPYPSSPVPTPPKRLQLDSHSFDEPPKPK
jgi:hypothetical protein